MLSMGVELIYWLMILLVKSYPYHFVRTIFPATILSQNLSYLFWWSVRNIYKALLHKAVIKKPILLVSDGTDLDLECRSGYILKIQFDWTEVFTANGLALSLFPKTKTSKQAVALLTKDNLFSPFLSWLQRDRWGCISGKLGGSSRQQSTNSSQY